MISLKFSLGFAVLVLLFGCSKREFGSITTFAFDHGRSGTYTASFSPSDLKNLFVQKHDWAKDALKHMPLYLRFKNDEKDLLIFGTKHSSLIAYNLKGEEILWEVHLAGELTSTPVYSEEKKTIFLLIRKNTIKAQAYEAVSISIDGAIKDRHPFNLINLYLQNGVSLKKDDINSLASKTAIGLNEINSHHYMYFGFSSAKNPYTENLKERTHYGTNRGATGLLVGLYIEADGTFSNNSPLLFSTSAITEDKRTGYDTGIYHSGGAAALLPDNTLLVATGNGPNFPDQNNFSCSIVRLDGQTLMPRRGTRGFSYLARELEGYHECHIGNNGEFTSSWPSVIQTKDNKKIGFIMDKFGDVHIFNPDSLTGNKEEGRIRLDSKYFFKSYGYPIYSNGSIFENQKSINLIIHHSGFPNPYNPRKIYASKLLDDHLLKNKYKPTRCLGLLRKQSTPEHSISFYHAGDLTRTSTVAKSVTSQFLESSSLLGLKKIVPEITGLVIKDQIIPLKNIGTLGFAIDTKTKSIAGYERTRANFYVLSHKNNLNFINYYLDLEEPNSTNPNVRKTNIKASGFEYFKKIDQNSAACPDFDREEFVELMVYEKESLELIEGLQIHSLDISNPSNVGINWIYKGMDNELVEKNSLVTVLNQKKNKGATFFNVTERNSGNSSIRILDTFSGELIKNYPISDKLHFSSLILTDYGIFAPTIEQGIIQLAFPRS